MGATCSEKFGAARTGDCAAGPTALHDSSTNNTDHCNLFFTGIPR
jgi:hypothetical protein